MNVAIKNTDAGISLGNPALTTYKQIERCTNHHFLIVAVPDSLPRHAVLEQFRKVAPLHGYGRGDTECIGDFGTPAMLEHQVVYRWDEIVGKPQGAMIF